MLCPWSGYHNLNENVETLRHVISYGQSLSVGVNSSVQTSSPLNVGYTQMFNAGARTLDENHGGTYYETVLADANIEGFVDLYEKAHGSTGESPCSMIANRLKQTTSASYLPSTDAVLVSAHGIGGRSYQALKKGSVPYNNILKAVRRARDICMENCINYVPYAVCFTQGEADRATDRATYAANLAELQDDLTKDINLITGLDEEIPLFVDQLHNWTAYGDTECDIPFAQWDAHDNEKVFLVGPKYFLPTSTDGRHLTGEGSAWLGSLHGEIIRRVSFKAYGWRPLYIEEAVRTGNEVILTYDMPVGNLPHGQLTFDTVLVNDPGHYGFRWIDNGDGNAVGICCVSVVGADQIKITLTDTPTGTGQKIGYADTGVANNDGGPQTGPRGCVRDNFNSPNSYSDPLYNWAIVQRIDVE